MGKKPLFECSIPYGLSRMMFGTLLSFVKSAYVL